MARSAANCLRAAAWSCLATALCAQERGDLRLRLASLPGLAPAARTVALRAIADDVLFCVDAVESDHAAQALKDHAAKGLFYSPAASEPAELWFEYVRALRRLDVRRAGPDPDALAFTLKQLLDQRAQLHGLVARLQPGNAPSLHDLTAFGWHGAGEILEATADLAERQGPRARAVGEELARFLACEAPHPLTPHQEGGAGVGEAAPLDSVARGFPIVWLDGYRIALARAVLATEPAGVDLTHATLHLLYSPRRDDRLHAIARLQQGPLGELAVPHLVARLDDGERLVVREAIVALGAGGPAATAARPALQRLAEGADQELRAIAAAALRQLAR